jgi:cellobiose epimerase
MDRTLRDEYIRRTEAELRTNILPFWMKHTVDRERGGFFGEVRADLTPVRDAERGSLLSCRILWTFSAAYRRYGNPEYLDTARWAYEDLVKRFWDPTNGGIYWSASADGVPLRTRKQIYGQAFAIYAFTEFHRATGQAEPLERAIQIFRLIEKYCRDRAEDGYFEAYTKDWKLEEDVRLSDIDLNEPKSQNTHLHVMEGYTNLLRVWRDPQLIEAQQSLVQVMIERILDPRTHHLGLFFSEDWKPRTNRVSFGHDIEAAWLLHEAAGVLGDPELLQRIRRIALEIARVTLGQGVDNDGALLYEADPDGITIDIKEWWPQAEAAVGFLDAYQIGGDPKYLTTSLRLWDFIEQHLVDRDRGEWYRCVNRDHSVPPDQSKASFWKCPYHNGRACMELADRLKSL